uniref:Uncharacterized protein n=1 Tax=Helianthus annuus TaxID=4232 RepID=A0A251V9D4_HELAN
MMSANEVWIKVLTTLRSCSVELKLNHFLTLHRWIYGGSSFRIHHCWVIWLTVNFILVRISWNDYFFV